MIDWERVAAWIVIEEAEIRITLHPTRFAGLGMDSSMCPLDAPTAIG